MRSRDTPAARPHRQRVVQAVQCKGTYFLGRPVEEGLHGGAILVRGVGLGCAGSIGLLAPQRREPAYGSGISDVLAMQRQWRWKTRFNQQLINYR